MRNYIIILSILCFLLSGFLKFKEYNLPVNLVASTDFVSKEPKKLSSTGGNILDKMAKAQAESDAKVKELQSIISTLASHDDLDDIKAKGVSPEVEEILNKMASEQKANRAVVKDLQATVLSLEDKLANEQKSRENEVEITTQKLETKVLAVLGSGSFYSGQVIISEKLMNTIEEIIPEIIAFPEQSLIVEGHTDNTKVKASTRRTYKDNMELSFLRAKAVTSILVGKNIPIERISVVSYGDTRPKFSNETAEGRAKNRRVEIKLISAKGGL